MKESLAIEMFMSEYDPFDNYVGWMSDDTGWIVLGGSMECMRLRPTDQTRTSICPIACLCNEIGDVCALHFGES